MNRVLFVCTGNLYRSPLAAAFFLKKLQADALAGHWIVGSAGTWTISGRPVPPHFVRAARGFGIELREHRTLQLNEALLAAADLIPVMEKGHREALQTEFPSFRARVYLLSELADQLQYDVPDPAVSTLPNDEIIAGMFGLIERAYPRICQLVRSDQFI